MHLSLRTGRKNQRVSQSTLHSNRLMCSDLALRAHTTPVSPHCSQPGEEGGPWWQFLYPVGDPSQVYTFCEKGFSFVVGQGSCSFSLKQEHIFVDQTSSLAAGRWPIADSCNRIKQATVVNPEAAIVFSILKKESGSDVAAHLNLAGECCDVCMAHGVFQRCDFVCLLFWWALWVFRGHQSINSADGNHWCCVSSLSCTVGFAIANFD